MTGHKTKGPLAYYGRLAAQEAKANSAREKAARDALRKDVETLIRTLNEFLAGEATSGLITPIKMHLQVHAVALAAIAERAQQRLKRPRGTGIAS